MKKYDVFGVGNAIVDSIAMVEDAFLEEQNLKRGIMTLANDALQKKLREALSAHSLSLRSGGSCANSMWTVNKCGGKASYTAKVASDENGYFYINEFKKNGIDFLTPLDSERAGHTGTCLVLTTPDTQRTMSTNLGISTSLAPSDLNLDCLGDSKYLFCEGYMWSAQSTKEACLYAMDEAKKRNVKIALTASDPFMVQNYREDFIQVAKEYCDILFCNADEALAFSEREDILSSLDYLQELLETVFVTCSEKGAYLASEGSKEQVLGFPTENAIDTNGAGDAFAGGVLFALAHSYHPIEATKLGNYLGSQVVQIHGSRIEKNYVNEIKNLFDKQAKGKVHE